MRVLRHGASPQRGVQPRPGGGAGILERLTAELRRTQRRLSGSIKIAFCFNAFRYIHGRMKQAALLALLLVSASPALAGGASSFTLVNGTSGRSEEHTS